MNLNWLGAGAAVLAAALLASCRTIEPTIGGPQLETRIVDLNLARLPYEEATLMIKGSAFDVTLSKMEGKDGKWELLAKAEGQVIEDESFVSSDKGLLYAGSRMESFEPPIPLFVDPVKHPDERTWNGVLKVGSQKLKASGVIKSSDESLNIPGGPFKAIRVDVELEFETTGTKRAQRSLSFWASEGRGLVKREFSDSSTRTPRATSANPMP